MEIENYIKKREGIGSLFHDIDSEHYHFDKINFQFEYELFYTGRQAFKFILDKISKTQDIDKIWMPNYYCQHVTRWIKKIYDNLYFYDINPFEFKESIDVSTFASSKDVVLINNYWGLSDTISKKSKFPIIIEDHSHGWLSEACLNSKADYCFASLRKSLPIPLGGIAWKPNSKFQNSEAHYITDHSFYEAFDTLHVAMNDKTLYKNGVTGLVKEKYLKVIDETEDFLDKNHAIIKLRTQDLKLINTYLNINFLNHKHSNLKQLYKAITDVDFMRVIKRKAHTSFGLTLLFKDEAKWSALRKHLIEHDIYPSFLWPGNKILSDFCYLLNVHVDFRYDESDMAYIAETINTWIKKNTN
jgi:hypothetical protein